MNKKLEESIEADFVELDRLGPGRDYEAMTKIIIRIMKKSLRKKKVLP